VTALLEPGYFAAVAVYAGILPIRDSPLNDRRIPIGFWIGEFDRTFSVEAVRDTGRFIYRKGFKVRIVFMPGVGHSIGRSEYETNLAEIKRLIRDEFHVPMSSKDHGKLRRIYGAFKKRGLHIAYSIHPTLKELMEQKGRDGTQQHFLATRQDYEFVRDLQLQNRIIPSRDGGNCAKMLISIPIMVCCQHSEGSYSQWCGTDG